MESLLRRVKELQDQLETIKPIYAELDELMGEIGKIANHGAEFIDESTQLVYTVVDNFAEKNVAFKACGVKRFEVKIEELEKVLKKKEKEAKKVQKAS